MPSSEHYYCRVCGCELANPPWGDDGVSPSFEICPCCGAEFGYEDVTPAAARAHRERWLADGAKPFDSARAGEIDLEVQLRRVPDEYQ